MGFVQEAGLELKIRTALVADTTVGANDISVRVDGDVVTLRGSVRTARQRERAEEIAREQGAREVINDLEVGDPLEKAVHGIPPEAPVSSREGSD